MSDGIDYYDLQRSREDAEAYARRFTNNALDDLRRDLYAILEKHQKQLHQLESLLTERTEPRA